MNLELVNPTPKYFGHNIRVLVDVEMNNSPWFVASDVCKVLGLDGSTRRHVCRLDPSDVSVSSNDTIKQRGSAPLIISEAGFYEFVLGSRKPDAIAFKRWACREVFPSLRRYGRYEIPADENNNPVDIPEVIVDLVRTLPGVTEVAPDGTIRETGRRMHVYEYLERIDAERLQHAHRAALGKIARRLLHTYELPVIHSWQPYDENRHWTEVKYAKSGTYPVAILDMAYAEFLKGMKD